MVHDIAEDRVLSNSKDLSLSEGKYNQKRHDLTVEELEKNEEMYSWIADIITVIYDKFIEKESILDKLKKGIKKVKERLTWRIGWLLHKGCKLIRIQWIRKKMGIYPYKSKDQVKGYTSTRTGPLSGLVEPN